MKNNNKDKALEEYLNALDDAAKQRNPEKYREAKDAASCIYEIMSLLRKYNIRKLDETVHILTSVMVIPIQMLEQDPLARSKLMRELASAFTMDIIETQMKDNMMKDTETGNELDRLRNYTADSETFGFRNRSYGKK